jgi:transposase
MFKSSLHRDTSCSLVVQRRSYNGEFKRQAVLLALDRGSYSSAAEALGIDDSLIRRWKSRIDAMGGIEAMSASGVPEGDATSADNVSGPVAFPGHGNPTDLGKVKLLREIARLKEENEILKKAVGIFSMTPLH